MRTFHRVDASKRCGWVKPWRLADVLGKPRGEEGNFGTLGYACELVMRSLALAPRSVKVGSAMKPGYPRPGFFSARHPDHGQCAECS